MVTINSNVFSLDLCVLSFKLKTLAKLTILGARNVQDKVCEKKSISSPTAAAAKSLQSCPTLCDPIDGSPPGSSVHGILEARTLEWVAISSSNAWKWKVKVKSLSRVRLLATPWTAAYQAPPSMRFSRQEYWSGVPLPSPISSPSFQYKKPRNKPMCIWSINLPQRSQEYRLEKGQFLQEVVVGKLDRQNVRRQKNETGLFTYTITQKLIQTGLIIWM